MAKLIWSAQSLVDLDSACEYIARDSHKYSALFAERIVSLIDSIPRHPWLGPVVPEYGCENLRERLFQNYRIVYRVSKDGSFVEIATIVHAARRMPPIQPT